MSRFRKVDVRIWGDEKFLAFSDDARMVFLFLLTHPGMTALGAMRATLAGLAQELGWSAERFRKALEEPSAKGMVEADERACFVALPNFLRYNQPENPNVVKAWADSGDSLPECDLKRQTFVRAYAALKGRPKSFAEAFRQRFGEPLAKVPCNGMANQEQEQEPEQEPTRGSGMEDLAPTHAHARDQAFDGEIADDPCSEEEARAWLTKNGVPAAEHYRFVGRMVKGVFRRSEIESYRRTAA